MMRDAMRWWAAIVWMAAGVAMAEPRVTSSTERAYVMTDSRVLEGACYDSAREDLTLFFRAGVAYRYREVPPAVFNGLLRAASAGRYYHDQIRGRYASRRLTEQAETAMIDRHDGRTGW